MVPPEPQEQRVCSCCGCAYPLDDFTKCQFCGWIACGTCQQDHFEDDHYDPNWITKEEFEELELDSDGEEDE